MVEWVDVIWGSKRTPLTFDRYPYPAGMHERELVGYEGEIINVAERFLEPGDIAVDVGACIGFHTCLFAKLVGETGFVLGFEPQAKSFEFLRAHVEANRLNNVALLQAAIWKEPVDEMQLWSMPEIGYSSMHKYSNAVECETVRAHALDDILGDYHPRLMKIDCEASELAALQGARKLLTRGIDCVVLELNYYLLKETQQTDWEIRKYMAALGYDMFVINIDDGNRKGGFMPPILIGPDVPLVLQGGHHINVMFSTRQKVEQRW